MSRPNTSKKATKNHKLRSRRSHRTWTRSNAFQKGNKHQIRRCHEENESGDDRGSQDNYDQGW